MNLPIGPVLMSNACRIHLFVYCLLLVSVAGCGGNPTVTIRADYIEKDTAGQITKRSGGILASDRIGHKVGARTLAKESVTVTIAEIGYDKVVLDISHARVKGKQLDILLGESKDVFLGDGSFGVRVNFSKVDSPWEQ